MNFASPFVTIDRNGVESLSWTIRQLTRAGLQVNRTFDLREAALSQSECTCPQHGAEACNCQMSVLLIYQEGRAPATLLLHSYQERTWFYLVDIPEQPVGREMLGLIKGLLTLPILDA